MSEYQSTLRDNIHRLTREHLTRVDGELVTRPALLDELEQAIHPNAAGGSTGSAKLRLPIDEKALALLQDIIRSAREHQHELIPSFRGTLVQIIQSWGVEDINGEWMKFLEHVTLEWCDKIEALLNPPRPWRPSQPCPSCGQRFHGEERTPTLAVYFRDEHGDQMHPKKWRMVCAACEAEWAGDDLGVIAHAIATV
jgi:hypothetical protein